jgi:Fe2+ transport system protein FeoA
MYKPLIEAAFGMPLVIKKMANPELAMRLRRMGLFEGSEIVRLDQEVLVRPVRVRGPRGEAVLGGGMVMKIVVHLDDGRKLPLSEMKPGDGGHIEGLTGGKQLEAALERLGLKAHDRVAYVRQLPPMEYVTLAASGRRVRLTEGMAAKIWGQMQNRSLQFVSARAGVPFRVDQILGGTHSRLMLLARGIKPGDVITLEAVAEAQGLPATVRSPIIVFSREGLRLYLEETEGKMILVNEAEPEK